MEEMFYDTEDLEEEFEFGNLNIDCSESSDSHQIDIGEEFLFPGSRMKVRELVLSLLTLSSSCHIPFTVIKLIMKMIELVCPEKNNCKTSMKGLYEFIAGLNLPLRKNFYCSQCKFYLGLEKTEDSCPCCSNTSKEHFLDVPMLGELKKILESK